MDQKAGLRLLSKRNILGAVLVIGIAAGVYLGDFWKGFGGGSTVGVGVGDPAPKSPSDASPSKENRVETADPAVKETNADTVVTTVNTPVIPSNDPVVVVIDDRSYYVRSADGDRKTDLKQVVAIAKSKPRGEGIRVRVYRRLSARTTAEIDLRDALNAAGIADDETAWAPTPLDANESPPETKTPR